MPYGLRRELITCGKCAKFIRAAPQYERNSHGTCTVMANWEMEHKRRGRPINPRKYDEYFALLGGFVWYPNIERNCVKFEDKTP